MKIYVTGASGFIGGAIAQKLAGQGHDVLAMSRSDASDDVIRALKAVPVRGRLGDLQAVDLQGCDVVVHCAAYVGDWGALDDFWSANVDGTTQLLEVAKQAGVKRFIHMGTEAALFRGQHMRNIDETTPYPKSTPFYYSRTKAEAEKCVLAANDPAADFTTISLRPRLVWGPGDQTVLPAAIAMIESGAFAWIDGGRSKTSTTHVHNICHAVHLLLSKGSGGEAYFVTDDEIVTFRDFMTRLVATRGVDIPERSLPGFVLRSAAFVLEKTWRLFGIKSAPPITRFAIAILARDCTINIDKAKRELGYHPVISIDDGLKALQCA